MPSAPPVLPALRRLGAMLLVWLLLVPPLAAQDITLTTRDGAITVSGILLSYDGEVYRLRTDFGDITVDGQSVSCDGPACPSLQDFVAEVVFSGSLSISEKLMPALFAEFARARGLRMRSEPGPQPGMRDYVLAPEQGGPVALLTLKGETSAEGFDDLISGAADIAMTLRTPRPEEAAAAFEAGIGGIGGARQRMILGLDALVLIVAPDNPIRTLTLEQARAALAGEIINWTELGGPDAQIRLLLPPLESAITDELQLRLLEPGGVSLSDTVRRVPTTGVLDAMVARDPFALGVTTLGAVGAARALGLGGACGMAVWPDAQAIRTEAYPLTTRLYLHLPQRRLPVMAREFLVFAGTDTAQAALGRLGFVGQNITRQPFSAQGLRLADAIARAPEGVLLEDLSEMVAELRDAEMLSAVFRFETGSTRMDARALANLALVAARLEAGEFDGRELIIAGFSDASGGLEANRRVSRQRANTVRDGLRRAATRADLSRVNLRTIGFGPLSPVACEDSPEGQAINRRVEIWLR
ncbi:MAG: substrate-binding domain-containing protein [Rhodobacteraceae bacterium]|nr:substrate-binding domain-containing protein [Paracoccaceae bacterium]